MTELRWVVVIAKTKLSPEQSLVLGILMVAFFSVLFVVALTRFEWLKKKAPFMVQWGRGNWRFPGSPFGICCAYLFGIMIGLTAIDGYTRVLPQRNWAIILLCSFAVTVAAGILDFIRHRVMSKNIHPRRPRS